jgi:hypothetical protein
VARRTTLATLVVAGSLLGLVNFVGGEERSSQDAAAQKYRELVQQLVSPNRRPTTGVFKGGRSIEFPDGYDVGAQKRINAARRVLHDNLEESLPFLIESLNDDRYCMTIDWMGDEYSNCSVGKICRDVIRSRLEIYRAKLAFSGPAHWHRYDYPLSKEWWKERNGRSLVDLQIEAVDWAIERRMAAADSDDRKTEIANLRALRDGLAASRTPVKGNKMLPMVTRERR